MFRFDPRAGSVQSEFGELIVVWRGAGNNVVRIFLPAQRGMFKRSSFGSAVFTAAPPRTIANLCRKITRLMAGKPADLDLNILDWSMTSRFQERVLRMESRIPRGMVSTYARIAIKLHCPGAARAVGGALAHNPFPVIIPCHRVVRSDGSPGGYAGGADMKKQLLELEGIEFDRHGRVSTVKFW